jgi:tRNA-2-methylthio-N6-dimethylallyladenosine synthase
MVKQGRVSNLVQSFYIKTFGCQMNMHDSDTISKILLNKGYKQTFDLNNAHIVLVNTCAVREKAEEKALSVIGRLSSLKKKRPDIITGVIGCVAQEKGANLLKRFTFLDLILGPRNIYHIDEFISKIEDGGGKIFSSDLTDTLMFFSKYNGYSKGRVSSFLKIMEGCDNFCSYCIVPFVRGRESSVPARKIISEANYLIGQGIKEITLIGQNVNSYNVKNNGKPTFPELLKELDKIEGLERLRFVTSHPKDLSDELITSFGKLRSLCPQIHLPFQSGSNNILKLMKRRYTRDNYIDLIRRLREIRPDIAITSDVIVGFPGEDVKDFEDTLRLVEEVKFDNLFSFKYSERPGTKAMHLPKKVGTQEKQKRLSRLQHRQREITLTKNKALKGTTQEILVEGPAKRGYTQLQGRTLGNKVVNFHSKIDLAGKLVKVKITKGFQNSLLGELDS